jgi:hypothetical protein
VHSEIFFEVFFGCACSRAPSEGLFSLGRVSIALCISIVSFKEHANSASLIQPAFQFLNVEMRFLMLAEGSTLGISLPFCLESLCRKTRPSCAGGLWMGLESYDQCFSESLRGVLPSARALSQFDPSIL